MTIYKTQVSDGVILPNPTWNYNYRPTGSLISRHTMSGKMRTYRQRNSNRVFEFTIDNIKEDSKILLENFLVTNTGITIHLLEDDDTLWTGTIIDDIVEFNNNYVHGTDRRYTVTLHFEGSHT